MICKQGIDGEKYDIRVFLRHQSLQEWFVEKTVRQVSYPLLPQRSLIS